MKRGGGDAEEESPRGEKEMGIGEGEEELKG